MAYTAQAARLIAARYPVAGKAVYGGAEPEGEALARSYRYWRARGKPAVESVNRACLDYLRKESRWHESGLASYGNSPNERGGRWIESPAEAGLRFVGFSDELASLGHNGWHLEPDGEGKLARGAVYQLPARDGRACYVEGVRLGSNGKKGWQEQCGRDGAAIVYLGERHLGERGGDEYSRTRDNESAVREAARGADREAEISAERERDWQEAWQAGQKTAELETEAAADKAKARHLIAERRKVIGHLRPWVDLDSVPSLCAALRDSIRESLESWRDKTAEAAELRGHYDCQRVLGSRTLRIGADNELRSAFLEGLG